MKWNLHALNTYPDLIQNKHSSEMNLKLGEYWEISEKEFLKFCQKLENSVKTVL